MQCVNDFTHFKTVHFLEFKGDATAEMGHILATHITPLGLKLGFARADLEGIRRAFFLKESRIHHERTPPSHTPVQWSN